MVKQRPENDEIFVNSLLEAIWRRRYLLLVPALLLAGAATYYAFRLPAVYRAEALLRAEPMANVNDFYDAPGNSRADRILNIDEQFRNVRNIVLSESVLVPVIKEFKLYGFVGEKVPEAILENMRKRVVLRMESSDLHSSEPRYVYFYVGFNGSNPGQVRDVANRLAELFIENASRERARRIQKAISFIQAQLAPLEAELNAESQKIKDYQESAATSLPEKDANLRMLDTLQRQYLANATSLANDEARSAAITAELNELKSQGALKSKTAKSDTEKKLDDLRIQYAQMQARYEPDFPELKRLKMEIDRLEQAESASKDKASAEHSPFFGRYVELSSELDQLKARDRTYKHQQEKLLAQIKDYESRIKSAPVYESELAAMRQDYQATQARYQSILDKKRGALLAEQFERQYGGVVFRVINPARLPLKPLSPHRKRFILLGLLGGLGLGIGMAFLAEQMDTSFESPDDFQASYDLPLLASVPSFVRPKVPRTADSPSVVVRTDPYSVAAEQYRLLAVKLLSRNGESPRTVSVTSPAGGEGKTVTAVNLAFALSGTAHRVLLVDADLRRPRVHTYVRLKASREAKGFADLLASGPDADLEAYIQKVDGICVIPGSKECAHPADLLASSHAREVLQKLRLEFQLVVIDSPPILPIADSVILSGLSDSTLVVLRARRTPREIVRQAMEHLDLTKVRGVVLNDVDFQHTRYAYAYKYYRRNYLGR